ncbi:MAG: hypothetical protein HYR84_03320 [Planctomycetes bacterium]|nr:hypothetical protein [Planctomycetota bacterium]
MKTLLASCAFVACILLQPWELSAQTRPALDLPNFQDAVEQGEGGKPKPADKDKDKDKKKPLDEQKQKKDIFSPIALETMPTYFNPQMLGNFHTIYARQLRHVLGSQTTTIATIPLNMSLPGQNGTTSTTSSPVTQLRSVLVPISSRGAFNIAENESPMPQDRIFFTYNFYDNVGFPQSGLNGPTSTTFSTTRIIPGRAGPIQEVTTVTTTLPGAPRVDLHREVIGFEKTFLDGRASIELRAPILQQSGRDFGIDSHDVGDLTIVTKYALLLDRAAGNVLSTGLAVTVPTGRSIPTEFGNIRDVLLQPWFGYIYNFDRFYVQGFHSIVVPTDSRDVTLAFNDVGLNYWLYRANTPGLLTAIVPTIEAHVVSPLNHRGLDGAIVVPDTVVFTGGVHLGLGRNATMSFGVSSPVTGPRAYNVEGFVQLNWRY